MVKGAADSTPAVRGLEPAMNALEAAALEEGCRTPPPAEAPEEPPEGTPPPKKRRARPPPPFSAATKEGALPDQQIFGGEGGEEDSSSAIVAVCGTTRVAADSLLPRSFQRPKALTMHLFRSGGGVWKIWASFFDAAASGVHVDPHVSSILLPSALSLAWEAIYDDAHFHGGRKGGGAFAAPPWIL